MTAIIIILVVMAVSTIMVIVLATNKVWDSEKGQWLISIFGTFIMFC
jgi:uncharacterized BrkB/YihY/UPF0761 family membrane protein